MAIIILAYLLGEVVSRLIGGFMPGSVLGMLMLFGALQGGVVKEDDIRGVANFILSNMMLFFVPVSVGLMVSYKLIGESWIGVVVTLLVSTMIVMSVVGLVQQIVGRRWKK